MSEIYAGAVLFNDWYASTHIFNSIHAATGSQCKSISALVTRSRGRRSQTRCVVAFKLAVVVREWTVAIQKV